MLPCMNCRKDVEQNSGKFVFNVFVCPECFDVVTALKEKAKNELENVLAVFDIAFQAEVARPPYNDKLFELQLNVDDITNMSRSEILMFIYRTYNRKVSCQATTTTPSTESTQLSVVGQNVPALLPGMKP